MKPQWRLLLYFTFMKPQWRLVLYFTFAMGAALAMGSLSAERGGP